MNDINKLEKSLSEDLLFWRADRPDEWTMDRFIKLAKKLESDVDNYVDIINLCRTKIDHDAVYHSNNCLKCRMNNLIESIRANK